MIVSVVLSTYNRKAILEKTLDSFFQMTRTGDVDCELVIVDNNSADGTAELIQSLTGRSESKIIYVYESRQGLSFARNAGFEKSKGEWVAFVDDDILFCQTWLDSVISGIKKFPDSNSFGGKIIASFETDKPAWLTDKRLKNFSYGATRFGDSERPLVFPEYPAGSNMIFKKHLIEAVGGFKTDLGRRGDCLISNEEKEYFYRVSKMGEVPIYLPDAVIFHLIKKSRMTRSWVLKRFFWQGVSNEIFNRSLKSAENPNSVKELRVSFQKILFVFFGSSWNPFRIVRRWFLFSFDDLVLIALLAGETRQILGTLFLNRIQIR